MTSLLIVGATGFVGKLASEQALADKRVSRVVALTRRPIASSDKLENVVLDFSTIPDEADWWSVDGVISALGTTRAAAGSPSAYPRTKGEMEVELKTLGFPSLTIVRPSVLDGQREKQRADENLAKLIVKILAPILPHRLLLSSASAVPATLLEGAIEAPPGIHLKTNEDMN